MHNEEMKSAQKDLKIGIWVYFILLVFEGALRKWLLPGLATPLLIVRDPVAAWLVFSFWNRGILRPNFYFWSIISLGIISLITALLFSHGNLAVAIFGARILFFHIPLVFVIGKVFTRDDVINLGKTIILISIPIAVIVALQFFSAQTAFINRGVGGETEGGFSGALGYSRPSATFSFNSGTTQFFGLVAAFIFYFFNNSKAIGKFPLIAASFCLLIVIPFSISRGLLFSVCLTAFFFTFTKIKKVEQFISLLLGATVLIIAITLLSKLTFFQTSTEVFIARFTSATEQEGGLEGVFLDRILGGAISGLSELGSAEFFGSGIGSITNVGMTLLGGNVVGGAIEGEFGRLIQELGPTLGIIAIGWRLSFFLNIVAACTTRFLQNDFLPWLILSSSIYMLFIGGWAQPTSLGFWVISSGLIIASFNESPINNDSAV